MAIRTMNNQTRIRTRTVARRTIDRLGESTSECVNSANKPGSAEALGTNSAAMRSFPMKNSKHQFRRARTVVLVMTVALVVFLALPVQAQFVCGGNTTGGEFEASGVNLTGHGATAAGSLANVACGTNADASGAGSANTATGTNANASGSLSANTATGTLADASGAGSINTATGYSADASGAGSQNTANGVNANASGDLSGNTATGTFANALGTEIGRA